MCRLQDYHRWRPVRVRDSTPVQGRHDCPGSRSRGTRINTEFSRVVGLKKGDLCASLGRGVNYCNVDSTFSNGSVERTPCTVKRDTTGLINNLYQTIVCQPTTNANLGIPGTLGLHNYKQQRLFLLFGILFFLYKNLTFVTSNSVL